MAACALLMGVYGLLSLANDPAGSLGTDTGAKVATLRAMVHHGGLDPDVGYWARAWDPTGKLHPLYQTVRFGDRWVIVTTLPALYAAYPLFWLGGYRAALVVPMLGSVATALAARALARRVGASDPYGWAAFWVVGLASPLTIYALDFWEHSLGVALLVWAVVWLFDFADRRQLHRAVLAGLAIGLAATMRTEALVYGAVATGVTGAILLGRRYPSRAVVGAILVGIGVGTMWGANTLLERATVGHAIRANRAAGVLTGGETGGFGARWREAAVTGFSLEPSDTAGPAAAGLLAAAALGGGLLLVRRADSRQRAIALLGAGAAIYAVRITEGAGFVPGMFAAFPVATAGVALGVTRRGARRVLLVACCALPLVWALQYLGGAAPQWGGRYILTSSVVLGVVGVVALDGVPSWARALVVGLAMAMTGLGLAWLSARSHAFGAVARALERRPEPVLVSRIAFFVREGGALYGTQWDRRWLTAQEPEAFEAAVGVLERAGVREFGAVEVAGTPLGPRRVGVYERRSVDRIPFFADAALRVVHYEAISGAAGSTAPVRR